MSSKRKIINDPVYGFIAIEHPLIFQIIEHPFYQRLRRIQQMALAHLVYPGATHTRLHHSIGAYHLMCKSIEELRNKGSLISQEEEIAAKAAILLHDIGHGPYSHALENLLVRGVSHEALSLEIMQHLNQSFSGQLDLSIKIFTHKYSKPFLNQLISGQLDVDRLDYLTRDSFYTGVIEGIVGYDRIIKMLVVERDQLMIEQKGIYSVEKFLVARRQMYWQVYLHKAVIAAEKMLIKIIERVRELYDNDKLQLRVSPSLDYFFELDCSKNIQSEIIQRFCSLDDIDIMYAVKQWSLHTDKVLSMLCRNLLNRRLYKCNLQTIPFDENMVQEKIAEAAAKFKVSENEAAYFVFTGEAVNTTYQLRDERINILYKDGSVKDISQVDNPLIHETLSMPVKKFYICQLI